MSDLHAPSPRPFSLYVHVPYCYQKCPYCDFNTYALPHFPEWEYVGALIAELDYRATLPEWSGRTVQSIFFGGGTPSVFSAASYQKFLSHVRARFPLKKEIEISLEANPGELPYEVLAGYRGADINRLSLGAQSLQSEVLRALGRTHTPEQVEASVEAAIQAGFKNISIDLMFGAPNQSVALIEKDLTEALSLPLTHLSTYGLTLEKGTPFSTSHARGILKRPPEEVVLEMMDTINNLLERNKFVHYEVSNYACPGFEAKHNLAYWNGDDYLGLGAGAHSFTREGEHGPFGQRWSNYALPQKFMDEVVVRGKAESWSDTLSPSSSMFEYFFLGLRKLAGISLEGFEDRYGVSVEATYPGVIASLISEGFLWKSGDTIGLTPQGVRLSDSVVESFG